MLKPSSLPKDDDDDVVVAKPRPRRRDAFEAPICAAFWSSAVADSAGWGDAV